ncbi:hypothetical protein RCZ04_05330 [Capnocytophaga sp. HP1101]
MGVACCKSDDDNNNPPAPDTGEVALPTKYIASTATDDMIEMVYTIEDGFIKEVIEYRVSGSERKEERRLKITPVEGKKLPAKIDILKGEYLDYRIEFSYNDQDQVTEIKKAQLGGLSNAIILDYKDGKVSQYGSSTSSRVYKVSYPDARTVVVRDPEYSKYTYTLSREGNLIKKVHEEFSDGALFSKETYTYEYDLQKKNPKSNLQMRFISLALTDSDQYSYYELYEATNSRNLVVKELQHSEQLKDFSDPKAGFLKGETLETEYKNEADAQGNATKITQMISGYEGSVEKYEY